MSASRSPIFGAVAAMPPPATSFSRLDDVVRRADAFGTVRVVLERTALAALGRHIARRAAEDGRAVVVSADALAADPWLALARRIGVHVDAVTGSASAADPVDVARRIAAAAAGAIVVVAERKATRWGAAVCRELCELAACSDRRLLLVVLGTPENHAPEDGRARLGADPAVATDGEGPLDLHLELNALSEEDRRRWWSGVVRHDDFATQSRFAELGTLDRWWQATRHRDVAEAVAPPPLSSLAERVLRSVVLADQALTRGQLLSLAGPECDIVVDELLHAGLVTIDRDCVAAVVESAQHFVAAAEVARDELSQLADALAAPPDADGWSTMRAAELHAELGDADKAELTAFRALRMVGDGTARDDLWQRWDQLVAEAADEQPLSRLVRSAEHALELGDGDRADRLARHALSVDGNSFEVLLLHGRTSHARGDVTTAALSLRRALACSSEGNDERGRAASLMAQVCYLSGDFDQAERYAAEAIEHGEAAETRLTARNVLGKLLLAREKWTDAERHFAEDACDAAVAGAYEDELRARLNRAIAILYLGRREQAREMLEAVMVDGERHNVLRAVTFALSNLASIAILDQRYECALALSERAIEIRRRIGGRVGLVQPITNLAELRLRLGMINEAEQGLRFGQSACGTSLPLSRYAYFAKVAACLHLERGDTARAAKEIGIALSGASCSGEGTVLAQCHRIAARIALADGDLARARSSLDLAAKLRHTRFGQAELAVLEAAWARASGKPYLDAAREAHAQAQTVDDPESLREAHTLLHHAYLAERDRDAAQSHLLRAVAERDRVADSLPAGLRERFLSRPSLSELAALEGTIERDGEREEVLPEPPMPRSRRGDNAARELVGQSTAMRSLRTAVKRVAATEATVLVTGETGTGKELVAEAIHRHSQRARGPLVKVNCAALVETLLLSELFGHERGAFTGASARRRGRFELAEGGTLFLDEIGDISHRTQVALLRVLQDGTYERVGGTTTLHANVRVICATHRDLRAMVARGEFREDLYYRLCGMVIEVPSLRDRMGDLEDLAAALLAREGSELQLSRDAVASLSQHSWPGNVRELQNALRVAALFAGGDELRTRDFVDNVEGLRGLRLVRGDDPPSSGPATVPPPRSEDWADHESSPRSLRASLLPHEVAELPTTGSTDLVYAEVRSGTKLADMKRKLEQECITRALIETGGNITRAASLLGMKRPRLSQLVKQYKLASVLEDLKS